MTLVLVAADCDAEHIMDAGSVKSVAQEDKKKTLAFGHFVKTRPCRFFAKGECTYGSSCTFAHGGSELRTPASLVKTSLCKEFLAGRCPHQSQDCLFAHSKRELRRVVPTTDSAPAAQARKTRRGATKDEADPRKAPATPPPPRAQGGPEGERTSRQQSEDIKIPAKIPAHQGMPVVKGEARCNRKKPSQPCVTATFSELAKAKAAKMQACMAAATSEPEDLEVQKKQQHPAAAQQNPAAAIPTVPVTAPTSQVASVPGTGQDQTAVHPELLSVGMLQLPVFAWQNRLYVGNVIDVLRQAEPECYED